MSTEDRDDVRRAREEVLSIEERRLQLSERVMLGDAQALEEDRNLEVRLRDLAAWLMRVRQHSKGPERSEKHQSPPAENFSGGGRSPD